jgi:hypothetical protein
MRDSHLQQVVEQEQSIIKLNKAKKMKKIQEKDLLHDDILNQSIIEREKRIREESLQK